MSDERYYIDIGGCLYVSTYTTLKKSPTLDAILDETATETPPFVDRDASAFQYILNFLRNGSVHVNPDDKSFIEFLMGEAQYFGLRKMESQLSKLLEKKSRNDLTDVVLEVKALSKALTATLEAAGKSA